jgi:ABC-type transport system involved in multi-copper enzyme maturation permease subunit
MVFRVLRAELFALRRRPAVWVLSAVWAVQIVCFAYLVSYLVWRNLHTEMSPSDAAAMHADLMPASVDHTILGSLPVWGGPVMLILGALVAAGDYRWGTFRTVLSRVAARTPFLAGRFLALAVVMLLMSVLTLLVSALSSLAVALVEGASAAWPGVDRLLVSLAAIWLITMAWASVGFALGLVTRNLAASIAPVPARWPLPWGPAAAGSASLR